MTVMRAPEPSGSVAVSTFGPSGEAFDETHEAAVGPQGEGARHVAAVVGHDDTADGAGGQLDLDERVAGRDQVGPVREHVDLARRRPPAAGADSRHASSMVPNSFFIPAVLPPDRAARSPLPAPTGTRTYLTVQVSAPDAAQGRPVMRKRTKVVRVR